MHNEVAEVAKITFCRVPFRVVRVFRGFNHSKDAVKPGERAAVIGAGMGMLTN